MGWDWGWQVKGRPGGQGQVSRQQGAEGKAGGMWKGGVCKTHRCSVPGPASDLFQTQQLTSLTPHLHMGKSSPRGGKGFLPKISQGVVAESGLRFTTLALLHCQYKNDAYSLRSRKWSGFGSQLDPSLLYDVV